MIIPLSVKNLCSNGKKIVISTPTDPWIPKYNSNNELIGKRTSLSACILTGVNGFGKTTIFNIISDIFGVDRFNSFNDDYYKNIHFDEFKICTDNGYIVIKHPGADTEFMIRSFDRGNPVVERLHIKYDPDDRSDVAIRKSLLEKHRIVREHGIHDVTHIRDDRFTYIHETTKCMLQKINESEYKHEIYERLKKIIDKRAAFTPVSLIDSDGKIQFLEPIECIPKAILDEFNIFAEVILSSSIPSGNIVLIDTPETNKHISIQEMFMRDLMSDDTYLPKRYMPKIIIATHSPYIVCEYGNLVLPKEISDIKSNAK